MKKLALILALLGNSPAWAGDMTAGDLNSFCNAKDDVARSVCRFYIFGVVQGVGIGDGAVIGENGRLVPKRKTILCVPDDLSASAMETIFKSGMMAPALASPDDLKLPAVSTVVSVMARAYPCPH